METLRSVRKERGIQRKFVADKLGVCPDHLNNIERGCTPLKPKYLEELANLYNIPVLVLKKIATKTYIKKKNK